MNSYQILGVAETATPDEIKAAYRKMAMKHHPDQHNGSDEAKLKFQEVQNAYDELRSDGKRKQYNTQNPFEGMGGVHDMFDQMFRQHFHQQPTNHDYHAFSEITLLRAFEGCKVEFHLPTGKSVQVDVPKGVHDGQTIVFHGAGGIDNPNLPPGNLNIVIRIKPNSTFGRQGDDIVSKVDVDLLDAILGCSKEIKSLLGETIKIDIPPNSKPQSTIRVPGQGMPIQNSDARGDMLIYLMVEFKEFSEEERSVLATLRT